MVEFALFLPIFLLAFFVVVEFGRTFFNFQGAVAGVRDAARYAARTIEADVCVGEIDGSGETLSIGTSDDPDPSYEIIERNLMNEVAALPTNVRIVSVATSYRCVVTPDAYRQAEVPIAVVFARLEIVLPLGEVLEINGLPLIENITTDIIDESRVFGA